MTYSAIPMPTRPSEPTVLEMSLYNYQKKAREFYITKNNTAPVNETSKEKQERIERQNRDWEHLKLQRKSLAIQAWLESQLEEYRQKNSVAKRNELRNEKHHPTKVLIQNLEAIGEPKPTPYHHAHHIIPGKGQYLRQAVYEARMNLHTFCFGINDPVNGVWLRNYFKNQEHDWATPDAPSHASIHRHNYEQWIGTQLGNRDVDATQFLAKLKMVKVQLKTGAHPSQILEGKDTQWSGK
ncbi:AHH domain-containing protein [Marinomonas sp. A3A]|uniref:AHH domain-containing protein n=1 Tax=Marinomonas sp. A3A TaxID=2065312 RepID=UPI001BB3B2C9|nr:AHH domain-containing protein [Marinomonas sp. A3A]